MARVIVLNASKVPQILRKEQHEIILCQSGKEVNTVLSGTPDIDLLITDDSDLPSLKELGIPVLVIIPTESPLHEVLYLELGASAVMAQPLEPSVLLAKVRALSRTGRKQAKNKIYVYGDLVVDEARFTVTAHGSEIRLTAGQFKVLVLLIRKPGEVLSRAQVIREISPDLPENSRSVDTLISSLRSELREAGAMIESKRGVGYVLRKEV